MSLNQNEQQLVNLFRDIKNQEWIPTKRHGDQCLGNTFEDLIGKTEDNRPVADFRGIEIKSHRETTKSLVTLFSKAPSYPKRANTFLRTKYGVDEDQFGYPVLNTTVRGDCENTHRGGYGYKAEIDYKNNRIKLLIRNLKTGEYEDNDIYWSFQVVENAINQKIHTIAIVSGEECFSPNGYRCVKYSRMDLIKGITLDQLLRALSEGKLFIDIRIGVYASGKHEGKQHDHGTAFRMYLKDLLETYGSCETFL